MFFYGHKTGRIYNETRHCVEPTEKRLLRTLEEVPGTKKNEINKVQNCYTVLRILYIYRIRFDSSEPTECRKS